MTRRQAIISVIKERKYAAKVISEACHNWVWKPLCKDGSIGIRPRLDMGALGEYLT